MVSKAGHAIAAPATTPNAGPSEGMAADLTACAALLRQGSRSFHLASKLLPRRVSEPAAALYAFCRLADDAVDIDGGTADAVADLHRRLDRIYVGRPKDDPVERALAAVVARFAIPRTLLDALLEGLAWDADGRRYTDIADLRAYAARVASTVGVITTLLMERRDPSALARAADLGVAMQLTNIARDVGEDARAGRLYLPSAWMRDAGLDPEAWLRRPVFDHRLASVVQRLLRTADGLYQRAKGGIALLPLDCRPGIHAARLIYAEIGREVERQGLNSLDRRAVVSPRRKLRLLGAALPAAITGGHQDVHLPPLPETRFLIEAVDLGPLAEPVSGTPSLSPWSAFDERIGRTIELFARLKQEELPERVAGRRLL